MKIQFLKEENYEGMYIYGKLVCSAHSLNPEDVAQAICEYLQNESIVETLKLWDFDDEAFTSDYEGYFMNGKRVWLDGKGFVDEWPF